jgi:hypothetical protein
MGFLDNLESTLNALEGKSEGEDLTDRKRQESDRAEALAAAPYADKLKNGPFSMELMNHATSLGWSQRMKVNLTWIGTTLRLDARDKRLELRPTPAGVVAVFLVNGEEKGSEGIDLESDSKILAERWLATPSA